MLHLSPSAIQEIARLQAKRPSTFTLCRIDIASETGPAWHYTLTFDESLRTDDVVQSVADLRIVIGAEAQPYLEDVTIDYSEDLMGGGFRFSNPNATRQCGCGHCFAPMSAEPDTPSSL